MSNLHINIKSGKYKSHTVVGVFPVRKPHNGKYVILELPHHTEFAPDTFNPRVHVDEGNFSYCDHAGAVINEASPSSHFITAAPEINYEEEFLNTEHEDDAMRRIKGTFEMMNRMTLASCNGVVTGLVISGPPGIGKSFGVIEVLERENELFKTARSLAANPGELAKDMFEVVGGTASNLHLYMKLYAHRDKGQVLVLDDSDVILFDEECLGTLKTVLDTGKRRRISYLKESRTLEDEGIPKQFDFKGSVIFLTNLDFEQTKNSKIKTHLEAIMSRCHYLDMAIDSNRDKILRIKQIVGDGMLREYQFEEETIDMIVKYIEDNQDYLRELSLRMVIKIARLVKADPLQWEQDVEATCLRRDARYKRLLAERV